VQIILSNISCWGLKIYFIQHDDILNALESQMARQLRNSYPDNTKNVQISTIDIPSDGRTVHLKGYGFVKVFRIVSKDGDEEHWATNLIDMEEPDRKELAHKS